MSEWDKKKDKVEAKSGKKKKKPAETAGHKEKGKKKPREKSGVGKKIAIVLVSIHGVLVIVYNWNGCVFFQSFSVQYRGKRNRLFDGKCRICRI